MSREVVEIVAGERPLREVNAEIRTAVAEGKHVELREPLSRHNLCVALEGGGSVAIDGSAGYYCGGLNNGGIIEVRRNAGWGVGEAMAAGRIIVDGYAGMAAGASMRGGTLHIKGDAGPRCGVAFKGGDVVVEGSVGFLSGFMAHAGRIVVLGDTADAIGDSLWGGEVWVAGTIGSLGTDTEVVEPEDEELASLETLLGDLGIADRPQDWKKIVSAQGLWHFHARNARAWLMI